MFKYVLCFDMMGVLTLGIILYVFVIFLIDFSKSNSFSLILLSSSLSKRMCEHIQSIIFS